MELLVICTIRLIPDEEWLQKDKKVMSEKDGRAARYSAFSTRLHYAAYLEGGIMALRESPILRLSEKPPPWELEPPCHSFLIPCSLPWRSTTTWRPELKGCRGKGNAECVWVSHRGKPTQNVKVFHRTGGSGKDITPFSEDKLTWSLITMGLLSSRSLKLLSRLMEWPPLRAGPGPTPGPSLPDRSARMRIGPLLSPARDFKERLAFQNHQATNNA